MINLPNPFESAVRPAGAIAADTAAAAPSSPEVETAAVTSLQKMQTTEPSTSTGGRQEAPAEATQNPATAGLLAEIEDHYRFVLDERAFMEALEEPPAFLSAPSPEYLAASEMMPMLAVLAGR